MTNKMKELEHREVLRDRVNVQTNDMPCAVNLPAGDSTGGVEEYRIAAAF